MDLTLRRAIATDAPLLHRWDKDPDVEFSGGADDSYDWDVELVRDVQWREIFMAELDGIAVGVVVLIDALREESHYWGHDVEPGAWAIDIWIGDEKNRSRGLGTIMMQKSLDRCFQVHRAPVVLIDPLASNLRAIDFYKRIGFAVEAPRRFGEDDCLVMSIRKESGKIKTRFGETSE